MAGTIAAALMGKVDFSPVADASMFHMIQPLYFGVPTFEWTSIITMFLVAVVSLVESTGVYYALSDITNQKLTEDDLARGYRSEGLASVVGGLFNSFPYTTFSQNVGLFNCQGLSLKMDLFSGSIFDDFRCYS